MTLSDASIITGIVATGCVGVAFAVRFGLSHFHATKIAPDLATLSQGLQSNTSAANANTAALARSEQTQKEAQAKSEAAFERMGDIISDHETRITVLEKVPPKPAAKRTASRRNQ